MCHSPMLENELWTLVHDLYQNGDVNEININRNEHTVLANDRPNNMNVAILSSESRTFKASPFTQVCRGGRLRFELSD